MPEFDLEHPPWAAEEFGGDSEKWGDEQDRSEWFEAAANEYAGRTAKLEALLAEVPVEQIEQLLTYNWPSEQRDFEEWSGGGEPRLDEPVHVFERMTIIDNWLKTAVDWLRELAP